MAEELHPLIQLLCEDRRYKLEAYQFVRQGLAYAQEVLGMGVESSAAPQPGQTPRKPKKTSKKKEAIAGQAQAADSAAPRQQVIRHVTGQDLSHALRRYAHDQYGLLAKPVLKSWGIQATADFGEIVYNLIKIGEMTKSEADRREDFDNVYDFQQALVTDFIITKPS